MKKYCCLLLFFAVLLLMSALMTDIIRIPVLFQKPLYAEGRLMRRLTFLTMPGG